jgi:hypothetical protein
MAKIGFKATIVVQVRPIGDHLDVVYDQPHVNNEDDVSGARQREARIRHGSAALRHLAGGGLPLLCGRGVAGLETRRHGAEFYV